MTPHEQAARELFLNGYNCAQAVFCAFCDVTGLDKELCERLSSSFGGGVARMREVCGAVSGIALVMGALFGAYDTADAQGKKTHYERVRRVTERFEKEAGSVVCRTLLGEDGQDSSPAPSERSQQYYQKRPCADLVALAAKILDESLTEMGVLS